jgi:hypothetical protein
MTRSENPWSSALADIGVIAIMGFWISEAILADLRCRGRPSPASNRQRLGLKTSCVDICPSGPLAFADGG